MDESRACRVCGWVDDDPAYEGVFGICACCGVHRDYEDLTLEAVRARRARWLGGGAPWFDPEDRPEGWDLLAQLAQVPREWR